MPSPIQLKTPDAELTYSFIWARELSDQIKLVSVVHVLTPGINLIQEMVDVNAGISIVRIGGGKHAQLYRVNALATMSDGESVPASFLVRVLDNAV